MYSVKVYYHHVYELNFFVKDLYAASVIMTSITNDSSEPSFEIYPIDKEEI